ncbi:MAG: diheme cytochrome c [Gammaproteobacteria bacterium]|jgi:hypothetical protein|nr:diheme cytochrome c [Gammaproteobacteria bacterium]
MIKRTMIPITLAAGALAGLAFTSVAAAEIDRYLQRDAGTPGRGGESLRITETPWFRHEHQGELPASVWTRPSVRSAANCEACHTRAAQGDYGERSLRVPR